MPKPKKKRLVRFDPEVRHFKPRGVPLSILQEVTLTFEELEAIRLADFEDSEQTKAAKNMEISQATFNRILTAAHKKIGEALVLGKAIKIEGGDYIMPVAPGRGRGRGWGRGRMGGPFAAGPGGTCVCTNQECRHEVPHQAGVPCFQRKCPRCGSPMVRKREA